MADLEKRCSQNKLKKLASSLQKYLANFSEAIKKEKEGRDRKKEKKEELISDNNQKTRELEITKYLYEVESIKNFELLNYNNLKLLFKIFLFWEILINS